MHDTNAGTITASEPPSTPGSGRGRGRRLAAVLLGAALLALTGLLGTVWLERDAVRVPVLLYHNFTWEEHVPAASRYLTPRTVFAREMAYLAENGYTVIPLRQLIAHMETGAPLPPRPVVLTFDDGYESNATLAYPILKHHQFPATIFLVASQDQSRAPAEPSMLSWTQMRQMEESGLIEIQAHTYDLHQLVATESAASPLRPAVLAPAWMPAAGRLETEAEYRSKLRTDFRQARETIERELGHSPDILAWPYGAYSTTALELGREAGFRSFVTLRSGMNQAGDSPLIIRRINVEGDLPVAEFAARLEPDRSLLRGLRQVLARWLNRGLAVWTRPAAAAEEGR